jgi:hypothetical protein
VIYKVLWDRPAMSIVIPRSHIDFLNRVYLLNRVTVTRLKKEFDLTDHRKLTKILSSLRNRFGIHLWVDVLQQKLGLGITLIVLKRPRPGVLRRLDNVADVLAYRLVYARSLSYTIDGNFLLVLQNPLGSKIVYGEARKDFVKALYSFNFVLRSKPLSDLLQRLVSGDYVYLVEGGLEEAFVNRYEFDREYVLKPARFDGVDLTILDVVEPRPEMGLRDLTVAVSKELGRSFSAAQIERHVVKHVENLVLGYRVAKIVAPGAPNYSSTLVTRCRDAIEFCSRAVSHPFVFACTGNSDSGFVGVTVKGFGGVHELFIASLSQMFPSYDCEPCTDIINSFTIEPYYILFGVPRPRHAERKAGFDVEVEYDPMSRDWILDIDVDKAVEAILKYAS